MDEFINLLQKAQEAYKQNFPMETCFERAVFFSWYCEIRDCAYCYMSTVKEPGKLARRSTESLLAEVLLCRELGWDFAFLSGGQKAYTTEDFLKLLSWIYKVYGEKIWINIGALSKKEMMQFLPYIKGVVGAIETMDPRLHKKVCPSKPIEPMIAMFKEAEKLGLKKAITIIIGLGETIKDFEKLEKFISENKIDKVHFYSLNPQKATIFEDYPSPSSVYQAEWIARTRVAFPKIDIQAGIWEDRVHALGLMLLAGANSTSKFPVIKAFGNYYCKTMVEEARGAGRKFIGNVLKLPVIDWDKKIAALDVDNDLKKKIRIKLDEYIDEMKKDKNKNKRVLE